MKDKKELEDWRGRPAYKDTQTKQTPAKPVKLPKKPKKK